MANENRYMPDVEGGRNRREAGMEGGRKKEKEERKEEREEGKGRKARN